MHHFGGSHRIFGNAIGERPDQLVGKARKRRIRKCAAHQRIFQHAQIDPFLTRLRTQLGHIFHRDATVFSYDNRLGSCNLRSNLSNDGFLFFKIQTQGLTSFSVTERRPLVPTGVLRPATLTGKSCWGTPSA